MTHLAAMPQQHRIATIASRAARALARVRRRVVARALTGAAVLLLSAGMASAQGTVPDSSRRAGPLDSARVTRAAAAGDSVRITSDTTISFPVKNSVDTIVTYTAKDTVVYLLDDKRMKLYGAAVINFGTMGLKSERITLNWDESTFQAKGIPDTSKGKDGRMVGTPVLNEGSEKYEGLEMSYNFKTKKGVIVEGKTAIDNGLYLGERIKRASDDVYFIHNGQYTTCDNPDHKHFYFGSPSMKVVPNDVIVAEPIVFFVEDIPLFALPFAVIPSKGGRSSGIIIPTFGNDYARGRSLLGGGYYLAASDYWDAKLTGDWYSKGGYRVNLGLQYSLRYNFSGSIEASYGRQTFKIGSPFEADDRPSNDYMFSLNHTQKLDPTSDLNANFTFKSNSYDYSFSNNVNELLTQEVYSRASYSTSWEGTGRMFSVNLSRNQNLRNGTSRNTLPDISFSQSQIFPFRPAGSIGEGGWWEMIAFSYNANAKNTLDVNRETSIRTLQSGLRDTVIANKSYDRRGLQQTLTLSSSPKMGYVSISPRFDFVERWYDHRIERSFNPQDSTTVAREVNGFFPLHTFSLGVSANTKLYGTFTPNLAGIIGIRHTITPEMGYSYRPDFSKQRWGYYQSYRGLRDTVIRYDPYSGYGNLPAEVFSGAGSGESQSIHMSIGNLFEMKLNPTEGDTTLTPRKLRLMDITLSTYYNMKADSLKLNDISLTYRTSVENVVDIFGSAKLSPYAYERQRFEWVPSFNGTDSVPALSRVAGHKINRYIASDGKGLVRLTEFTFSASSSLNSEMFAAKRDTTLKPMPGAYEYKIPWTFNFGFDYEMRMEDPDNKTRGANVRAGLTISPTPNWRISANGFYNIASRFVGPPQITVSRDLHCWEMNFSWVPAGELRSFQLVIRLKAPQLQDIKLERKGSDRGVYNY